MTLSFRKYLDLENLKKQLSEATESNDFPNKVFAYLSVASMQINEKETWEQTVVSLLKSIKENQPNKNLPLIRDIPKENNKPLLWDYEGRGFWLWGSVLCKAYGWSLEYVSDLDVNDAFALLQEILTDNQLEKEFQYSLSEVAYPYNKTTRTQNFKPLSRPYWMRASYKEIKKIRIKKSMLPVGYGVDVSGLPEEYGTKIYLQAQ